ncbi:putative mitogen-activated protein kinase kinase kinase [Helianthus anomalus]
MILRIDMVWRYFMPYFDAIFRESRVEDGVSGSLRSIATTIHLKHPIKVSELIRCGARGQLYMGMNLDSGELCTVRQEDCWCKDQRRD